MFEEKRTIYLIINNEFNKSSKTSNIKITQERLLYNFELNKLYEYNISRGRDIIKGYFIFINTQKPDDKENFKIDNISNDIIILSYEKNKITHF